LILPRSLCGKTQGVPDAAQKHTCLQVWASDLATNPHLPVASPISCTHIQYPSSRSRYAVVQFRFVILGIHATAHRLSSASILSYLRSSLHPVSFTAIVFPRAMSSPCYHYPPRSTEPIPIPLVLHHVVLRILPHHRCHLSLLSYPLALILSLFIIVVVLYIYVTNRSIEASQEFGP
jgi:hypothetical protein